MCPEYKQYIPSSFNGGNIAAIYLYHSHHFFIIEQKNDEMERSETLRIVGSDVCFHLFIQS